MAKESLSKRVKRVTTSDGPGGHHGGVGIDYPDTVEIARIPLAELQYDILHNTRIDFHIPYNALDLIVGGSCQYFYQPFTDGGVLTEKIEEYRNEWLAGVRKRLVDNFDINDLNKIIETLRYVLEQLADTMPTPDSLYDEIDVVMADEGHYMVMEGMHRFVAFVVLGYPTIRSRIRKDKLSLLSLKDKSVRDALSLARNKKKPDSWKSFYLPIRGALDKHPKLATNRSKIVEMFKVPARDASRYIAMSLAGQRSDAIHDQILLSVNRNIFDKHESELRKFGLHAEGSLTESQLLELLTAKRKKAKSSSFNQEAQSLEDCLRTKVKINSKDGRGEIVIKFTSEPELRRLLESLPSS